MTELFLTPKEKRDFINSLFIYYKSGIPLIDSIKKISEKSVSPNIKTIARGMYHDLNKGQPFNEVMVRYEKYFGKIISGLLISGDESGKLVVVLSRIQKLLQKENYIKNKIKDAMVMPTLLVMLMIFVLCLFFFFIFPMLEGRGQVNVVTQAISAIIKIAIVFGIIFAFIVFAKKNHFAEKKVLPVLSNIPKIKRIIDNANWSNFFLVLYVAYEGGLPITSMLDLASETIQQFNLKRKIKDAIKNIMKGSDLSGALSKVDEIPEDYLAAIASGEVSGELNKSLEEIITEIDETTDLELSALSKMIEPMMTIICAIGVLFIAVNFYKKLLGGMSI